LASLDDFLSLELRVGTVVSARALRGARRPSYALSIDFGPLGQKNGCARIAGLYEAEDLVGLQVVAIVNLPVKRVAGYDSEVLVLAVDDGKGESVLLIPERPVPDAGRVS
jgi:tRNA-binding protein